jgi:hypothetical protein
VKRSGDAEFGYGKLSAFVFEFRVDQNGPSQLFGARSYALKGEAKSARGEHLISSFEAGILRYSDTDRVERRVRSRRIGATYLHIQMLVQNKDGRSHVLMRTLGDFRKTATIQ